MLMVITARKAAIIIIAVFLVDGLFFSGLGSGALASALLLERLLPN